jgi:lipoyl(octanoyl) transferase
MKKLDFSPKKLVLTIQNFVKDLLKEVSINCNFVEGAPGVYVDKKKIASIGLRISKGKTYHGISINFDMDLSPFKQINPCGYEGLEVTQIKDLNKDISKLQLEKLVIDLLRNIF